MRNADRKGKQNMKDLIKVGDRFYFNTIGVRKKCSFPDLMRVTEVFKDGVIKVKPEYRSIETAEFYDNGSFIWRNSNRNPACKDPKFIFLEQE